MSRYYLNHGVVIEDHMAQWSVVDDPVPPPWNVAYRCAVTWEQTGERCDHAYLSDGANPPLDMHRRVFPAPA